MIFEHRDYRAILSAKLNERPHGKPVSRRAFAEKIGVSAPFLTEILSGKKTLSVEGALRIALCLDLTGNETQYFCLLVQLELEKKPAFREMLERRLAELAPSPASHDLAQDLFQSISEWHHAAILELNCLPGFRLNAAEAARRLPVTAPEAAAAIERLARIGLLEKDAKGAWRRRHNHVASEAEIPNGAFRNFHGQILGQAQDALAQHGPATRLSASDVLAFDSRHFKKADRLSREFSAAVLRLSDRSKVKDKVYALSVHFFPLDRPPAP